MNSAGRSRVLCATLAQVGKDTQALKEPVTRWHRAAWSHLYCRDTIVVLVPHSADLFCGPWHRWVACVVTTPALSAILLCPHVATDKTNKRENRYFLLSSLASPFCILYPSSTPLLRHPASTHSVCVLKDRWEQKHTEKSTTCP